MLKRFLVLAAGILLGCALSNAADLGNLARQPMPHGSWHMYQISIPKTDSAALATQNHVIFVAPAGGVLWGVRYVSDADVTGQDTNTRRLVLYDGSTALDSVSLVSGTDLTAGTIYSLYDKTGSTPRALSRGDVLYLYNKKVGNGMLTPRFLIQVFFEPRTP